MLLEASFLCIFFIVNKSLKMDYYKNNRKFEILNFFKKTIKLVEDKIWLSSPHMGEKELQYVTEAFQSNWIAPMGPLLQRFEDTICDYNGISYAAALSSGTAAIHLALEVLKVSNNDLVLVQSFTFCGSVNPVLYTNATPIFIDSEPHSWNMCPEKLVEALDHYKANGTINRIKAIIPVHLYGMPASIDEIVAIGKNYGIPIIEDAAESLGSHYKNKYTGTFGEFGVYSFNGNKIITTSGGGALVSYNASSIEKAKYLSTQAREPLPFYEHKEIGFNYRMSNVLAGIGVGQLEALEERISQRRAVFDNYRKLFSTINSKGYHVVFQEEQDHVFSNRWLTAILIEPDENKGLNREDVRLHLEQKGIDSRPLWKPMHLQPIYKNYPVFSSGVSERLYDIGLCLPSGSNLSKNQFERIEKALNEIFK